MVKYFILKPWEASRLRIFRYISFPQFAGGRLTTYNESEPVIYLTSKFQATSTSGGLCNQIFELISLIGIARKVDRIPYIAGYMSIVLERVVRLNEVFPNLAKNFAVLFISKREEKMVSIAGGSCCTYGNLSLLRELNDTEYIVIDDPYTQSFKYFDDISEEVRSNLLRFDERLMNISEVRLFDPAVTRSSEKKLCVHIRRRDFIKSPIQLESRSDYTTFAIKYVANIESKSSKEVNVLLFGDDVSFEKEIAKQIQNQSEKKIYTAAKLPDVSHLVDIAFASRHCDSIILTASSSTFGWWMAYLARPNVTVYYNPQYGKTNDWINPDDFFLPHWIPLGMNITESNCTHC